MNVRDPRIDELAQKLAQQTGEDPTAAVIRALEERLARNGAPEEKTRWQLEDSQRSEEDIAARTAAVMEIVERVKKLPVLDDRSPDEIIGYNEYGHFD